MRPIRRALTANFRFLEKHTYSGDVLANTYEAQYRRDFGKVKSAQRPYTRAIAILFELKALSVQIKAGSTRICEAKTARDSDIFGSV